MKQELYIVSLPDYSVSPIISGATKEYIGTKEDIDDVIQDGEVVIAKQGVVLSETTYYCLAAEHTFINTYGFDYTIKTEKTEAEIVYFYEGKQYLRCVKTKMKDLQIGVDGQNYYKPDSFMGHPNILFIENGWLCSKLFAVEQVFKSKRDCLLDMVKSTIGPYFRKKELTLKELEARHIQQFYTEKLKTVTPNSVIHYHAVIYQALKYAMKTDMVPQNVAMKVDRPRKNSFQPTFLDAEQMQKLFEVVKGTRLELPVLVAAFYGLRRGEVLGLKWDAIDFNRGTLTIKRTVTEATIDGTMKIIEQDSAKTKSSLRTLPLVGSFRDYFQKVKEAQELNKKVCGNCYNYDYDGYVFVNELGERMRPNYLTEYFPKYIAKHGMPKMRFHDLRHSCASLLLANGVPLKQIQEWLGHSDFSTTANIYAHLDYRSKISSAQAMEQGMLLPRSDDFGSRWENVTEQGKITEPDLNPGF